MMRLVHYNTTTGRRVAFVEEVGRKRLRVCVMGSPIDTKILKDRREERYMTDLDHPMKKAAKQFRAAGKRLGITKNATKMLRRVQG